MHWAVPTLVAEIRFAEWTNGGHLRGPVLLELRLDRAPEDCLAEKPMNKTVTPVTRQSKKSLEMTLTHQDKLNFSKKRLTKSELLTYHEQMVPVLLPYLKDRPSSLPRFPRAILRKSFFPEEPSVDDSRVGSLSQLGMYRS